MYKLGLDIGSTTIKVVLYNELEEKVFELYERHQSKILTKLQEIFLNLEEKFGNINVSIASTGTGAFDIAEKLDFEHIQEIIAARSNVIKNYSDIDIAIELGGEDAKIIYFTGALEQRMNGVCAGGTGAFIDQIASLLDVKIEDVNEIAKKHKNIYDIASRCGVFAKTDIQALVNQGATKEDILISVYQAIVNQTITGLAQGRPIKGKIIFLGGPLFFASELRGRFIETLELGDNWVLPSDGETFLADGCAITTKTKPKSLDEYMEIIKKLLGKNSSEGLITLQPLFETEKDYKEFEERHAKNSVKTIDINTYSGNCYIGVDAGSTTSKMVVITEKNEILYESYKKNLGNPIEIVKTMLIDFLEQKTDKINIVGSCSTGYGEKLIQFIFDFDSGEIETIAHYKASSFFNEDVDYIIDIGGQDMKTIEIKDKMIAGIALNEACSSGCGSFIQAFASSLGYEIEEFAKLGIFSEKPVDLGTRCTVFMNSSVKHVQKSGATVGDISAGLAYSVIKNVLYKLIQLKNSDDLGKNIIVQGGTFYNNAVLRSLEIELNREVIRPNIAGLMGAFGCAIVAKEKSLVSSKIKSSILSLEKIKELSYNTEFKTCKLCTNKCKLNIIDKENKKYVIGNRCEKGEAAVTNKELKEEVFNMFKYVNEKLFKRVGVPIKDAKLVVGIPRVLNMYQYFPLWHSFFTSLGIAVVLSPPSTKKLYNSASDTITSDTLCFPAKIANGHIKFLMNTKVDAIFYPRVIFEFDHEELSNIYECPVVTSYPENLQQIFGFKNSEINYMMPQINFNRSSIIIKDLHKLLKPYKFRKYQIKSAYNKALIELAMYKKDLRDTTRAVVADLNKNNKKAILLNCHTYQVDDLVSHGIDEAITQEGLTVLSTHGIYDYKGYSKDLYIINQWAPHSNLYKATKFVIDNPNVEMIQLQSFSCGIDAITTDQIKTLLNDAGRLYTKIKIDEISNLGAAKIRIRSLKSVIESRGKI